MWLAWNIVRTGPDTQRPPSDIACWWCWCCEQASRVCTYPSPECSRGPYHRNRHSALRFPSKSRNRFIEPADRGHVRLALVSIGNIFNITPSYGRGALLRLARTSCRGAATDWSLGPCSISPYTLSVIHSPSHSASWPRNNESMFVGRVDADDPCGEWALNLIAVQRT